VQEKLVVASLAVIFFIGLAIALTAPETPEIIYIERADLKAEKVNESFVEIKFLIRIRGEPDCLVISIYDLRTNLLIEDKKFKAKRELNFTIPFEKDKNYRIVLKVLKNDKIVNRKILTVHGLDTLVPKEKVLKIEVKDVDFKIVDVTGNRARVSAKYYINSFEDYEDVKFHVKAVQLESNVLADEVWFESCINKEKTNIISTNITIPKNYNYLIKLEAWRSGKLLKIWKRSLNLSEKRKIVREKVEEEVGFKVEEFTGTGVEKTALPSPLPSGYQAKRAIPGFEVLAFFAGIGGALVWRLRRT